MSGATSMQLDIFTVLMQRSIYDDMGIDYRMPNGVEDADGSRRVEVKIRC